MRGIKLKPSGRAARALNCNVLILYFYDSYKKDVCAQFVCVHTHTHLWGPIKTPLTLGGYKLKFEQPFSFKNVVRDEQQRAMKTHTSAQGLV